MEENKKHLNTHLPSEEDLILRVRSGDREAFGPLVARYQASLRMFAARWIPSSEDVLDVVQESFIDAYKHLDRFDTSRDFRAWLLGICRHRIAAHLRTRGRQTRSHRAMVDEVLARSVEKCEIDEDESDSLQVLRTCLTRLSPEHRQLLEHRYVAMGCMKDIAAKMSRSVGAVTMLLQRLKTTLRQCLESNLRERQV